MNATPQNKSKCIVIGAGFAGLSAAASLARKGLDVTVLEKNEQVGGRARVLKDKGFVFDMGPSWYWMPDVIDRFFESFGKSTADYFTLRRLDPSYQVIFDGETGVPLPADFAGLRDFFESTEKGAGARLEKFLEEAKRKYETGMRDFVYKPSTSLSEYASPKILSALFTLDLLRPFSAHARKYFKNPRLLQIIEFPVLFLGAMPARTPALYSMMNYADMKLGTWYPMGGMHRLVDAMAGLAREQGATIRIGTPVQHIHVQDGKAVSVETKDGREEADVIVAGADYHHVEQHLLDTRDRTYPAGYWEKRTMAPSCLLYYIGVGKKLKKLIHHNLFFDEDYDRHAAAIYVTRSWPDKPLFYVCCPSVTDDSVAPKGMENLFILVPVAAGLRDTPAIRKKYFEITLGRLERFCGENISGHVVFEKSYASSDFISDYNAFRGNAYGLANTLRQTAMLKPSIRSKKVRNLFYTGQLTVPGPGVPPSIISGQVVADYIYTQMKKHRL